LINTINATKSDDKSSLKLNEKSSLLFEDKGKNKNTSFSLFDNNQSNLFDMASLTNKITKPNISN